MHRRSVLFFAGLILLQSVLYGFGDPISKAAYETMSVYSLMTVRYAIAVAALLLVCGRRIAHGLRAVSVRLWLVPSLCIAAGYVLNNIALNLTTATSATFLRSMAIILTPILAFLIHRTRYRWVHIPAAAFGGRGAVSFLRRLFGLWAWASWWDFSQQCASQVRWSQAARRCSRWTR